MRARLCRRHFGQAPAGVFAFATEPPCKLALDGARCVLVAATGTPARHLRLTAAFYGTERYLFCRISIVRIEEVELPRQEPTLDLTPVELYSQQ